MKCVIVIKSKMCYVININYQLSHSLTSRDDKRFRNKGRTFVYHGVSCETRVSCPFNADNNGENITM